MRPLIVTLRGREAERERLNRQLVAMDQANAATQELPDELRAKVAAVLADWRRMLRSQAPVGRQILIKLIAGTLRFTARSDGRERWFEFEGEGILTKLFAGSDVPILVASLSIPSWNQLLAWLKRLETLRDAGSAA